MVEHLNFQHFLNEIERSLNNNLTNEEIEETIKENFKEKLNLISSLKIKQEKNLLENEFKTLLFTNIENIISLFNNLKNVNFDFSKSKRILDSLLSQMTL